MIKVMAVSLVVSRVSSGNPASRPGTFTYIDLSAVDQERKSIVGAREIPTADAPSRARQIVAEGDVLVSTVRPNLNAVAVVGRELAGATASTGFSVLRPSTDLNSRYLFHWVRSPTFIGDMVRKATGASYPAVSDTIVGESLIPLPPIEEQRRIADILDRAEALRTKRREALAHLADLTQSIFVDMFGDPGTNERGLELRPLIDWVDTARPITYGILKPGEDQPGGVKYVRVVDMKNGSIDPTGVKRTSQAISDQYKRSLLCGGDILMSIRGHVGRLALVPAALEGANITQDTARLAVDPAAAVFVMECMRTLSMQHWMQRRTKGAAVQGINLGDLKQLPIPVPSSQDRRSFTERATATGRLRLVAQRQAVELAEVFTSLQHRAFAGQL